MSDKTKPENLDDDALEGAQGGLTAGGRLQPKQKMVDADALGGNFVATSSGVSVPGSDLMEGEGEEELQTRPSPESIAQMGKFGPPNPGIK